MYGSSIVACGPIAVPKLPPLSEVPPKVPASTVVIMLSDSPSSFITIAQYIIAQFLGAIVGQLLIVAVYWPYFKETTNNQGAILSCFATGETLGNTMNGFWAELIGTGILTFTAMGFYRGMPFTGNAGFADIGVGLVITALVMATGGPTGPALNPARDLGPRIVHALLPIPNKGSSNWSYAWVPVVATTLGAIIAIFIYKVCFGL